MKVLKQENSKCERLAYSLKEVAEMLGLSEGHLRNEHKRGKLKFSKSSDRTLILATELHRYLTELPERPIPIEVASDDDQHYRSVFDGLAH